MSLEAMQLQTHQQNAATPTPTGGILQRQCACGNHTVASGECAECRKKRLQRKATNHTEPETVPPIVHEVLRSPGQPLDPATRAFMEPRFGQDFSQVRVHTDAHAAESAQAVNALAYTVGRDVVFGDGSYAPHTSQGIRLLTHELTHVVQQDSLARTASSSVIKLDEPGSSYEREARQMAASEPGGGLVACRIGANMVQRQPNDLAETESPAAKLRRQAETTIQALSQAVANADARGYVGIKLTIRFDGEQLIPGFQSQEPQQPRPSGMIPRLTNTVAAELRPVLDMILLSSNGDWVIEYRRNANGYMALGSQTRSELPAKPAPTPQAEQKKEETPAPPDPLAPVVQADCKRVMDKLDEIYYSDADEKTVMDILYRWAFQANPSGWSGQGSFYLQTLFDCLAAKPTKDPQISYYNKLFARSDDFPRELKELRNYVAPARATSSDIKDAGVSFELDTDAPKAVDVSTTLGFLSNDQKRVLGWLKNNKEAIVQAETKFKIDRRAIAGAIAWEALENVRGSWTPSSVGPGKVHIRSHRIAGENTAAKQTEEAGYLPKQTFDARKTELAKPSGAITYIAAIMKAGADIAFAEKGFEISKDPPILCFMYQTDDLPAWRVRMQKKSGATLDPGESMGRWVKVHMAFLEEAVGQPAIEPSHPATTPVQRFGIGGAIETSAWKSVHLVLASPRQSLDFAVRQQMGQVFNQDFGGVHVHDNSVAADSARQFHARAYTVDNSIAFSAGQYRPQTRSGRHLIAHELAHVVQQARWPNAGGSLVSHREDAAEVEARGMADAAMMDGATGLRPHSQPTTCLMREDATTTPTFGTAKTTAPVAKLSPRSEMLKDLTDEVALLNNAQVIVDWALKAHAKKKPAAATTDADDATVSFSAQSLLSEKAVLKQLKPVPKTADDLAALLELLVYYDVITVPIYTSLNAADPEHLLRIDPKTKQPNTARFAEARRKIETFTKGFEQRAKRPNPLDPVVVTELLASEMAAGSKAERKPETDAQTEVMTLEQQLAALEQSNTGDEASQTKQLEMQAKIAKAKEKLRIAAGYHTFASPVVNLLKRLHQLNTSWKAGTYVGHSWGEFSADVFLSANLIMVNDADEYSGQYWDRTVVRKFFDDLNTVAEQDDPQTGKFAWRAIYNDKPLAVEINKKFGAGRVVHIENHGPAPDHKLHIHLDLRPINLQWDEKRGYRKKDGRVEIL